MPCNFSLLSHPGLQHLSPYVPGKSIEEVAKKQGIRDIIKLASNENALGCSPQVIAALNQLTPHLLSQYPVYAHHAFLQSLSDYLRLDSNMLTLANGSDALFAFLLIGFALGQDKHILTHQYAFSSYAIQAQTHGIPVVTTPMRDWQVDIDAIITTCTKKTALIFLANPNNPTGGFISFHDIQRLLEHIPDTTILVLDEAYYDYLPPQSDTIDLLKKYSNLVITRTFSKAYGLAGLRLGYAIANPQITSLLKKIHLPFAVNIAALIAAHAALKDQAFILNTRETIGNNKEQLVQQLELHHISYLPSVANFITINCQVDCQEVVQKLEKNGIIVRPLHPYSMPNYMRVTIGTLDQNQRFLKAFLSIIKE